MIKHKLTKIAALLSAIVLTTTMAACSGGGGGTTPTSDTPQDISFPLTEKQELSFITLASADSTQEPNERAIFKRMEEKTNVHINWTCFVQDQFGDKKNIALANAKSLPDGLFQAEMSDYDLLRYAKQGVIIPLETLIDQNMPNLKKVLDENPEYRTLITATDGHIYGFPWIEQLGSGKEAIQSVGGMPFINKKWLETAGLEVPKTTEELRTALQTFKEKDLAGDGQTIPMSFIINGGNEDMGLILGAFGDGYGDVPDHIAVSNDKKIVYTAVQEGYKEGLKFIHELAVDGLIDPEAYTQDWATYVSKGKAGRYGMLFSWDCANIAADINDFVPLPALIGPDGKSNMPRASRSATSGLARGRSVLTANCKNTALAAAWIDQMYDPMQSPQNNWGTYGEDDKFNIFEMSKNEAGEDMLKHMDLGKESPVEVRNAQSVGGPLAIMNSYYGKYVSCPDDAQYRLDWIKDIYVKDMNQEYVFPNIFLSQEDEDEIAKITTDLDKYVRQMKSDFVMNGEIDQKWDEYITKLDSYGLQKYIEILQRNTDAYFAAVK